MPVCRIIVSHGSRPVIMDLSSRDGEPTAACQQKVEYITGISYEFVDNYEADLTEQIVMKNERGSMTLVSRSLDGKRGFLDFSSQPIAAGKCKFRFRSSVDGYRRVRVVVWIAGERRSWESMDV